MFPPANTSEECLASGYGSSIVRRTAVFSAALGSLSFTCHVDDQKNPFADCLNTMARFCNPIHLGKNSTRITFCKTAVNDMARGMNRFWRDVRKECGQWSLDGFVGQKDSKECDAANIELQKNAYYLVWNEDTEQYEQVFVSPELTTSVKVGLWDNTALFE